MRTDFGTHKSDISDPRRTVSVHVVGVGRAIVEMPRNDCGGDNDEHDESGNASG